MTVKVGSPARYTRHYLIAQYMPRASSSIMAYLLSGSLRNLNPHVTNHHGFSGSSLRMSFVEQPVSEEGFRCLSEKPSSFVQAASVLRMVSALESNIASIGGLTNAALVASNARPCSGRQRKVFFFQSRHLRGSAALDTSALKAPS